MYIQISNVKNGFYIFFFTSVVLKYQTLKQFETTLKESLISDHTWIKSALNLTRFKKRLGQRFFIYLRKVLYYKSR